MSLAPKVVAAGALKINSRIWLTDLEKLKKAPHREGTYVFVYSDFW